MSEATTVHRGSSRPATWLARLGFEDGARALSLAQSAPLAGLIDLVRERDIPADSTVLFAHLGGQPALNAYHSLFPGS